MTFAFDRSEHTLTLRQTVPGYAAKEYQVVLDGQVVGRVASIMTTFDRKPQGSRIVTRRTRSTRWYGHNVDNTPSSSRCLDRTTRWAAITDVLAKHYSALPGSKNRVVSTYYFETIAKGAVVEKETPPVVVEDDEDEGFFEGCPDCGRDDLMMENDADEDSTTYCPHCGWRN